jgi:hypothetical protein
MKTVIVTLETVDTKFPAGTAAAGISISISGGSVQAQLIAAAPYTASFQLEPGTYTASAQSVTADGTLIGASATSAEFTVADSDVTIAIPSAVTVAIQ